MATWVAQRTDVLTGASARALEQRLGARLPAVASAIAGSQTARALARAGVVEVQFHASRKHVATGWLDRATTKGVVFSVDGPLLCWVRSREAVPFVGKVPPELARAVRTLCRVPAATSAPVEKLRARRVGAIATLAAARALPAVARAQLTVASRELCGRAGLAALLAEAERRDDELVQLRLDAGREPRFDAWAWSTLDDGVLFAHGKRAACGLALSEGSVHDMTGTRDTEVAAVQAAWRALRKR